MVKKQSLPNLEKNKTFFTPGTENDWLKWMKWKTVRRFAEGQHKIELII